MCVCVCEIAEIRFSTIIVEFGLNAVDQFEKSTDRTTLVYTNLGVFRRVVVTVIRNRRSGDHGKFAQFRVISVVFGTRASPIGLLQRDASAKHNGKNYGSGSHARCAFRIRFVSVLLLSLYCYCVEYSKSKQ